MKYEIAWTNMPIDIRLKITDHSRTLHKNGYFTLPYLENVLSKSNAILIRNYDGVRCLRFPSEAHYTWCLMRWA